MSYAFVTGTSNLVRHTTSNRGNFQMNVGKYVALSGGGNDTTI